MEGIDETNYPEPLRVSLYSQTSIDLSVAGWFLLIAALWELLFNRLASALGIYGSVGATGVLSWLASSGRVAMNVVGIMALILACICLPRLAGNRRFAVLPGRIILMLSSPFFLPVICVSIFRPVSEWLVLVGYLVTTFATALITILVVINKTSSSSRRVIIALGLIQLLGGFELMTRFLVLYNSTGTLQALPRKAYLLAEVLFVSTPIFAFFALNWGRLLFLIKRPHKGALLSAIISTSVAVMVMFYTTDEALRLIAFRTLGITVALPGGVVIYLIALFFGVFLVGTLTIPSDLWLPTDQSRRVGLGLVFIWVVGIQPTHPYQFALTFLGFLYLARGLLGGLIDDS